MSKYKTVYFIIFNFFLNSIWSKLRHHSKPSEKFKENLRADLFEKIAKKDESFFVTYIENIKIPESTLVLKIERDWSVSSLLSNFTVGVGNIFSGINRSLLKGIAFFGTGIAATLLILPLFSVVSVPNSLALEPSVLRSISGNVDIFRSNKTFNPVEYQELYNFDIVTTTENSTSEIIFFDGTILRLAENTSIQITKIDPHSFLFSTGEIHVTLLNGNVWVKTFKDSSLTKKDGLFLKTPSLIITPNKSALSIHYQGGKEWVYAVENSTIIGVKGLNVDDNILLEEGEMINFSIFDEFTPLNEVIPGSFFDSNWVGQNLEKDILYTSEYLDTISDKMQEKYIMSTLSVQVEGFLRSNPSDEELSLFIKDINSLMLVLDESHKVQEPFDIIPTATVTSTPVQRIYNSRIKSVVVDKKNLERFSIEQEEILKQEEVLKQEEILKQEVLLGEGNIEKLVVENSFGQVIKLTATQIAENRRAQQKEEQINSAVNSFSEQINVFKFENSRETTALNLLDNIPATIENIELLRRIEMTAPADVKKIVEEKRKHVEKINNIVVETVHEIANIKKLDISSIPSISE